MSNQLAYKPMTGIRVECSDCEKPFSHHPATNEAAVFDSIEDAREFINRTSLWAAGVKKVICGSCLTQYTRHKSAYIRDMRERLRNE